MKPRVGWNVGPEQVMQLADDRKPVRQRRQLEHRRNRVSADVVVKTVSERQIDMPSEPLDKWREIVRVSVPAKQRNGPGFRRARGRARRRGWSAVFGVHAGS